MSNRERTEPVGPKIRECLAALGFEENVIRTTDVANLIEKNTGQPISRQRISALMNAVYVEPKTLEFLARGLGVRVSDLVGETSPKRRKP